MNFTPDPLREELDAAREELTKVKATLDDYLKEVDKAFTAGREQGRREGLEEAAKVADEWKLLCDSNSQKVVVWGVAHDIRALSTPPAAKDGV